MIGRLWRGWAEGERADEYERLLIAEILPEVAQGAGAAGAHALRREADGLSEFLTLTLWESMEAVRRFAGDDVERAVVPPEAGGLLSRFDDRSIHYRVIFEAR